jgi:hypothetical protein
VSNPAPLIVAQYAGVGRFDGLRLALQHLQEKVPATNQAAGDPIAFVVMAG